MTVTITPRAIEPMAAKRLKTATSRVEGIDRIYRLYPRCDLEFRLMYLDGTPVLEARSFANHNDAVCWIEEDDRQRRLLHSARVKV